MTAMKKGREGMPIAASHQTPTEGFLTQLCRESFLNLWSWPNVYKAVGKELCDLLVVFGDSVILFSDKSCSMGNEGPIERDWARWYRKAVAASANQIFGAERWLKSQGGPIFEDARCSAQIPLTVPRSARFHRVVVAHGAAARCRAFFEGGSGSLMIDPAIVGSAHEAQMNSGASPFHIGPISEKQFVHVLDESALALVFDSLNTITDFLWYLDRKEAFLRSGRLGLATGEEELLAYYLKTTRADGHHDFVFVGASPQAKIMLTEGIWNDFSVSKERRAQFIADKPSYLWDALIDRFAKHAMERTQYHPDSAGIEDTERALRVMAAEPRTVRRMLCESLFEICARAAVTGSAARSIRANGTENPYVFFSLKHDRDVPEATYRDTRRFALMAHCKVQRLLHQNASYVVGIATEASDPIQDRLGERSEDLILLDTSDWTDEREREARAIQAETQLFVGARSFRQREREYPTVQTDAGAIGRVGRNDPCPCKSGVKYKKCCGLPPSMR